MKLKKISLTVALLLVLSMVLSGCSSVKSAWIATRFGTAVKRTPITAASGTLTAALNGKTLGIKSQIKMDTDFQIQADAEKLFAEMNNDLSVLGIPSKQKLVIYHLPENDRYVTYAHMDQPELWGRAASASWWKQFMDIEPATIMTLAEKASKSAELATVESEKGTYYLLKMIFSVEDIRELMVSAGIKIPAWVEIMDLNSVAVPVELEISGETFLPRRLKLTLAGVDEELLAVLCKQMDFKVPGTTLLSGELCLEITEFSCAPQKLPALPEEAKQKAGEMAEFGKIFKGLFG